MPPITTSQIVDFLDANLNEGFQDGLKRWPEEYSTIFNVLTSTKAAEKDSYESGFQAMPQKAEGVAATYDRTIPGIAKTYVNTTYALGYEITEEAIEDNLNSPETFAKLPQALLGSMWETIEVTSFNEFNNGFSTNGFDGVPLFSASHPLLAGGTQSNTPSTQADLSVTSLQAGIAKFDQFVDERGLHKASMPSILMVAPDNQFVANELVKSEYRPDNANNAINEIYNKNLRVVVCHYLTDTDAWFLIGNKDEHALKFFWRVRPGALRKSTDFDTTNLKHLQRIRFSVGYSHYKGTYGSSGA